MAFIGIDRGIVDHWIYKDAEYFKVWFEMLYRARYVREPKTDLQDGELYTINYGEFMFGRISWSDRLNVSEQRLRTLIKRLIQDDMITLISNHRRFSIYKIKNYEKFNQQSNQQETQSVQGVSGFDNQHGNHPATSSQPANNQQPTTKEQGKQRKQGNKETRKEYADYVFLTETEYDKLTELLGPDDRDQYFLRFASWISGKTKREQQSRSAYLSILNWHREDQKKLRPFPQRQQGGAPVVNKWDRMIAEEEAKQNGTHGYHQTGTDLFG